MSALHIRTFDLCPAVLRNDASISGVCSAGEVMLPEFVFIILKERDNRGQTMITRFIRSYIFLWGRWTPDKPNEPLYFVFGHLI